MDHDGFGTDDHISEITKISRSTLKKLRVRGGGPPFLKVGRSVRYYIPDVLTWMAQHERRSTSDRDANRKRGV